MRDHGVIWITGLSGTGKTTLAELLQSYLITKGIRPVMLDGDTIRRIYPIEFGYSREDRFKLAASYGRLAREMVLQGHLVICSTISLFHAIHQWNREHLPGYLEIWLRVPLEELHRRDARGIYAVNSSAVKSVAGIDFSVEFPEAPDLIIDHFGNITPQHALEHIIALLEELPRKDF